MFRLFGALLCCTLIPLSACTESTPYVDFQWEIMGTVANCNLQLADELSSTQAQHLVTAVYDSVNATFSTWQTTTELSRLNRAPADSTFTVSPRLYNALQASAELYKLSGGAFDITAEPLMRLWGFYRRVGHLPSVAELDSVRSLLGHWRLESTSAVTKLRSETKFDLGGIAKGLAVDLAVVQLRQVGVTRGLVDLGGNLFCMGGAPERTDWRVGVRDPLDRDRFFASIPVTEMAVATSGSYERFVTIDGRRYGHIMNPATGLPATDVLSATVIAPTAMMADGLSTALFVLGRQRGREVLTALGPSIQAILVVPAADKQGVRAQVLVTNGLIDRIALRENYNTKYESVPWR